MPLLSPVEIIKTLLPGLIALTSLLLVIITFLLEKYIPVRSSPEGRMYRNLIWWMAAALILSGIGAIFSLLFLLGIRTLTTECLLILCIFCILLVVVGTAGIVIKETFKKS